MQVVPRSYFAFRSCSVLLDEVWLISIPLYLAQGASPFTLGIITSASAVGDLLGMVALPWLASRYKSAVLAIAADVFQVLAFLTIAIAFFIGKLPDWQLGICAFVAAFGFSLWFGASDTLFTKVVPRDEAQNLHKKIAISQNVGPVLGPAIGAIIFSKIGLGMIAMLNAASFLGQVFSFFRLEKIESTLLDRRSFLNALKFGWITVFKNPALSNTLIFPIVVKVFVFGFIPFLVFWVKRQGYTDASVGYFIAPYGIGVLGSSLLYREKNRASLASHFRVNAMITCLAGFILIQWTLLNLSPLAVPLLSLTIGFFLSRYQIQFRTLRQLNTDGSNAANVITVQGLIARAMTPLSGFVFAFLFSVKNPSFYFIPTAVVLIAIGIINAGKVVASDATTDQ